MSIFAVWGPPRSGKTTVAIDLAFALSRGGSSTLLLSCECYSELSARLNTRIEPEKSLAAVCGGRAPLKQLVHTVDELLYVLAVPFDCDAFDETLSEVTAKSLLTEAERLFDAVIIDCPSHTGSALAAWGLSRAERVLLLSGSQSCAVMWHNAFRRALDALSDRVLAASVEINEAFDHRTLHTLLRLAPRFRLPHYPDAEMLQLVRRTLYQSSGRHGKAYTKAIDGICTALKGEEEKRT